MSSRQIWKNALGVLEFCGSGFSMQNTRTPLPHLRCHSIPLHTDGGLGVFHGNSIILIFQLIHTKGSLSCDKEPLELVGWLEHLTCWLRISCSTDWATLAFLFLTATIIPYFYPSVNTLFSFLRQYSYLVFVYYYMYYCKFSCKINAGVFIFCIPQWLLLAEKLKNFVAVFRQFLANPP